jgi:hypothetical protein
MDTSQKIESVKGEKKFHFEWVLPTFIHPQKTIEKIVEQEKPVWLTPLTILSGLILLAGLIAGPIRRNAILTGASIPANFQYYSADQQSQFLSAQSTQSSSLFTVIFPIIGGLLGLWITWFLLSAILHMSLTLAGSRSKSLRFYNLVGWAMLPIAVRQIIQILAMLIGHTVVNNSGLSGFVTGTGGAAFLAGILGQIDLFFLWELVLLYMGVHALSGLSKQKASGALAVSVLIVVLLVAVPKLMSGMLSGLSLGGLF